MAFISRQVVVAPFSPFVHLDSETKTAASNWILNKQMVIEVVYMLFRFYSNFDVRPSKCLMDNEMSNDLENSSVGEDRKLFKLVDINHEARDSRVKLKSLRTLHARHVCFKGEEKKTW
ncbi:F-box/RNI-like/FBD-like domains-containing protein [Striga asiatica]|uniref:F-box/RNI-like/FBD-like domains-containing protein n=1 Tax=Striga asiatica TaxID=4170 RepID=A0A5A7RFX2_STRAF|nr:F-box/RNI-like/FBD-like domains-containing protein [Striga asiatica]